jgi:hypothetical protein
VPSASSPQALPALSEKSVALGAPSSCDVLFYYHALNTSTGRHRDAFTAAELAEYYEKGTNPFARDQWVQTKGTDVLIFSMGNCDMQMGLSFPLDKADARDREIYVQPRQLRIPLRPGSLLVYSAFDDLFFCHEVAFPDAVPPNGVIRAKQASLYRVAFVFRWLNESQERLYYLDPARNGRHVPSDTEVKKWSGKRRKQLYH